MVSLRKKQKSSFTAGEVVQKILYVCMFIIMAAWALSMLYALFWILSSSLKDNYDFFFKQFGFPTWNMVAWSNYEKAFRNLYIIVYTKDGARNVYFEELLFNTLYITLVSAFLSIFVPTIVSYAAAKYKFWFNKVLHAMVVFSMVVPISGSLAGQLQVMETFGLYDNLFIGTIIMRCGFLGANFLYMYSAFKGISNDFSDAAFIDGAGHFRVFFQIMLPMVKNMFTMFFLLQLISWWNTWDFTLIYMPTHPNLAQAIYNIQFTSDPELTSKPIQLAVCVIAIVPALILFFCFKNKIMTQVSFGGLKG